jgi:hypothetical protein
MTQNRHIVTDQDGARAIQRLIQSEGSVSTGGLTPSPIPTGQAVVVRLQSAITAGSTDAVTADVMELQGGSWQTTGATIEVRSLTGQAISITGRRIARRIGRHGWGVVET